MTPGAGGIGLNTPQASVMIRTEVWWNRNTELQMHHRMRRPGLEHHIRILRLFAKNAKVDKMILLNLSLLLGSCHWFNCHCCSCCLLSLYVGVTECKALCCQT